MRVRVETKEAAPVTGKPWTRHYDPDVPASLVYPSVPLQAMLDDAAENHPSSTATIFFTRKRSYRSISDAAWRFANGLRRLGVKTGDRVALVLPNSPQFVIAFYGALRAGAVVVPCNPLYTPPELQHQLADSGSTIVVTLSRFYPVVKAARAVASRPGAPAPASVEHVIVTNIKEEMPPILRVLFTLAKEKKDGHRQPFAGDPGAVSFKEVLTAPADPFDAGTGPDDLAVLQYTGGTTGTSKGAMLSHRALVANTLQCRAWFTNLRDGADVAMAVMPFFHVYGLTVVMSLAVQGAAAMILEPQFELERVLKDVQRYRPKLFCGAPR
ncbi:MAG: long-chain fatty acid--CoA ligase, partial [Chloroflexi bacterium]